MEPLGAEECHSSESGWTMYIGSPVDDNDDGDNHKSDDDEHCTQARPQDDYDDASDDSMASDASSGPSHHGFADLKRGGEEEYDGKNKYCLEKKANKRQEKLMMEGKKVLEKKGKVVVDSKGKSQVQEVRKKCCEGGKRK
ncbi:uncharacterized protein LOC109809695 isoform X2 [Cajanus cajan]|uniref:Uncharacterized protein n=2 Tax=Cajanus cajan TaxID=3821 RepID=A0A151SPI9_CAJCA|nr:uncharacterized protein LOC109809695 isoform X2 [Cajanus cajan]XP_020228663.1 uncharacterized protein LOC109809695 isoform X2 [Cajanus cajan]KYP56737.1 hypothetical protein KK1_002984 [Cajanus cajan]